VCLYHQGEPNSQRKMSAPLFLAAFSALGACVPYPHSVTRNPATEGRVLSAETGLTVAGAKIELDIGSDEFWGGETVSDAEGRFAFAEQRNYRLISLLADAPRCWTRLSISAPGYHPRRCGWISMHGCSSEPMKLPHLTLQPDHLADLKEEAPDDIRHCIESAMEKAN
jgi:hypothetical protein